jgi:hypothetical protein
LEDWGRTLCTTDWRHPNKRAIIELIIIYVDKLEVLIVEKCCEHDFMEFWVIWLLLRGYDDQDKELEKFTILAMDGDKIKEVHKVL